MSMLLSLAGPTLIGLASPAASPEDALPPAPPAPDLLPLAVPYGAPLPAGYLATMVQEEEEEPQGYFEDWQGNVKLGAALATGNSESQNADLTVNAVKENTEGETVVDRWTINAFFSYAEGEVVVGGSTETQVTRRISGAGVKYDHYLDDRTYLYGESSILHDSIGGVDSRITVGGGIGHTFVDEEDFRYSGEVGLSYVFEDLKGRGTDPTVDPDTEYLAARVAHVLDWQIAADLALHHEAEAFPSLEDSDDIYVKAFTDLRYAMSENLSIGFGWLLLYDNTPVPGNDRVDNVFTLTAGWLL